VASLMASPVTIPMPIPMPMAKRTIRFLLPIVAAAVVLAATEAAACPNCKDAVNTADPDGLNLARGYFYSILIMLAMPLTLVGSFGVYVWRELRRQERLAATESAGPMAEPDHGLVAVGSAAAAPRP
jgi:hypothetical protein